MAWWQPTVRALAAMPSQDIPISDVERGPVDQMPATMRSKGSLPDAPGCSEAPTPTTQGGTGQYSPALRAGPLGAPTARLLMLARVWTVEEMLSKVLGSK